MISSTNFYPIILCESECWVLKHAHFAIVQKSSTIGRETVVMLTKNRNKKVYFPL